MDTILIVAMIALCAMLLFMGRIVILSAIEESGYLTATVYTVFVLTAVILIGIVIAAII